MLQLDLFDLAELPPHQRHSETSRKAAVGILPGAATLRRAVLDLLVAHPDGLTDEQIQDALEMNPSTQRPRRVELVRSGLVRDSGQKRLTRSGRRAVVWLAARHLKPGEDGRVEVSIHAVGGGI